MFRKVRTKGGWYCEQDMKKPVSEGGLAFTCPGSTQILILPATLETLF